MYKYSPIKSIQIKNFRNLGNVSLDFNDSPIITLIGENESGKTSIVKAFGVCAMHQTPRSQKDFIRDGTTGFGVAITLEDGTMITRMKTTTSNVYRVQNADGTVWEAKKLENTVPKAVSDVMGLIEEPETKELLQIRTYEDQLLFVVTPASTNYKVMYDSLKISQLTRAIKVGSTEANGLKADINSTESSISAFQSSLSSIRLYDIEPMLNIRDKLKNDLSILDKLDTACSLKDTITSEKSHLGTLSKLNDPRVSEIDETLVISLTDAGRLLESLSTLKSQLGSMRGLREAESIDIGLIEKIHSVTARIAEINELKHQQSSYSEVSKLGPISEIEISLFSRVDTLLTQSNIQRQLLSTYDLSEAHEIDNEALLNLDRMQKVIENRDYINQSRVYVGQLDTYTEQVISWMKQLGVATVDCPKCGEAVIVDIDRLNTTN